MRRDSTLVALTIGSCVLSGIPIVGCGAGGKAAPGEDAGHIGENGGDASFEGGADAPSHPDPGSFFGEGGAPDRSAPPVDACTSVSKTFQSVPLDIMLVLDNSASMAFYQKWASVEAAINDVFGVDADGGSRSGAFPGAGVGIQYFPLFPKECSVDDYANPAVAITPMPGASTVLADSLRLRRMYGGTPTTQVMLGITQYLQTWATTPVNGAPRYATRKPIVILATDGVPDEACLGSTPANSVADAVAATAAAATGTPPIETFVIGVGADLGGLDALQAIASAGGTGQPFFPVDVNASTNVETQFVQALKNISMQAIPCDYPIPDLGGALDSTKINVGYTPASGQAEELFVFVGGADSCRLAADHGWYLDDTAAPTKVILCPQTCSTVKANQTGRLEVMYGCQTVAAI